MITIETWLPLLLLPLPILIYRMTRSLSDGRSALAAPEHLAIGSLAGERNTHSKALWQWVYLLLLWTLLIIACCRPVWVGEPLKISDDARNVLLAVDISESMLDRDIPFQDRYVRRIELVKYRLGEFIARRESDRLGLILFADNAYLQAPLTFDNLAVGQFLQDSRVGFAGRNTAIGDAIGLGVKRLIERPEKSRILILLTDGANTAGNVDPDEASKIAAEQGIKIYTIGIYQQQGFLGIANQAAAMLKRVAERTGGEHFIASNDQELESIYRILDDLEPVTQDARYYTPTQAYFHYPLGAFFLLLLVGATRQIIAVSYKEPIKIGTNRNPMGTKAR